VEKRAKVQNPLVRFVVNCSKSTIQHVTARQGRYAYFHTADTDKTRQDCLVLSVSAVYTKLETSQDSFQ